MRETQFITGCYCSKRGRVLKGDCECGHEESPSLFRSSFRCIMRPHGRYSKKGPPPSPRNLSMQYCNKEERKRIPPTLLTHHFENAYPATQLFCHITTHYPYLYSGQPTRKPRSSQHSPLGVKPGRHAEFRVAPRWSQKRPSSLRTCLE